jgi:hypothetical protein
VNTVATSTALAAPGSVTAGSVVTLNANVTTAGSAPFGSVSFFAGTRLLGTKVLPSGGNVAFSTASLPVGAITVHAEFNANGTFSGSTSPSTTITVQSPPALKMATVTSLREAIVNNDPVLIGQVTANGATIQGMVTLIDNGTVVGEAAVDGTGSVRFNLSTRATGSHTYVASYSGNPTLATSSSPELQSSGPISGNGFYVQLSHEHLDSITVNVIRTTLGADGNVDLSCGDGLPDGFVCSFSPASLRGGETSRLTIQRATRSSLDRMGFVASMLFMIGGVFMVGQRSRRGAILCGLGVVFVFFAGCSVHGAKSPSQTVITAQASSGSGATKVVRSAQIPVVLPSD